MLRPTSSSCPLLASMLTSTMMSSNSFLSSVIVQLLFQFFSFLFIRFVIPLFMNIGFEPFGSKFWIIRFENINEIVDIGGGKSESLDLAQLGVTWNIGNTVP